MSVPISRFEEEQCRMLAFAMDVIFDRPVQLMSSGDEDDTVPTVRSARPLWDLKHPEDPDWKYE